MKSVVLWRVCGRDRHADVVVKNVTPTLLAGALVTWQHSLGGDDSRPYSGLLTAQPLAITRIGGDI